MIAVTGFFGPNVIYGDMSYVQMEGTSNLRSPEEMFNYLIFGSTITINLPVISNLMDTTWEINWAWIMGSLVVAACVIGWAVGSLVPVAIGLMTGMFVLMYNNSKTLFDEMLTHLDSITGYVGLMIGLGVLIVIVITIMDYSSGQKNV